MPNLDTNLHLKMYEVGRRRRSLSRRLRNAFTALLGKEDVYGIEWGDPDVVPPLKYVRDHFLLPYLSPNATVLEIGPGGGRWTRYMLPAAHIYAVDYHQELLSELSSKFGGTNITMIKNNGDDFPGIPPQTIDFVFSFGTFVHLDLEIIDGYLRNLKALLKPQSNVVIQYSDKTKPLAVSNGGFSDNDPDRMRALVLRHGYSVLEEDVKTLWHSALIRIALPSR